MKTKATRKSKKENKTTEDKKFGRPPRSFKIDSEIVQKILSILKIDGTIEEACGYAEISKVTHYSWIEKKATFMNEIVVKGPDGVDHKKYVEKLYEDAVEEAQGYAFIYARKTLFKSINNSSNPDKALEFLKRRDPRYKDKTDSTFKGDPDAPVIHVFIPDNKRDNLGQKKKSSK